MWARCSWHISLRRHLLTISGEGNGCQSSPVRVHLELHCSTRDAEDSKCAITVACHHLLLLWASAGWGGPRKAETALVSHGGENQHFPQGGDKEPASARGSTAHDLGSAFEHMLTPPELPTYLVQHLELDHQLHAGQRPYPHAPILATSGTVRLAGAEDHLVYLWDPVWLRGCPAGPFLPWSPAPGCPHRNICLLPKST